MHLWKFCTLLSILLFVTIGIAAAHPPGRMELAYSEQTGEVVITVTHVVDDPALHYIKKVDVRKNGETVISETYAGQPSKDTFTYRYPLILSPGDEIVATAECSIGGSATARFIMPGPKAASLIMPGPSAATPAGSGTTPRYVYHAILMVTGILFIIAAGLLPVYGRRIPGWYRIHIITAVAGSILVIPAVFLVFRVPYLSATPSSFTVHVFLGILLILSLLAALFLALIRGRAGPHKAAIRSAHLWAGRAFIILVLVNILIGLSAVGIL
jgi:hypothetical protein